jgi:hypothetical protein
LANKQNIVVGTTLGNNELPHYSYSTVGTVAPVHVAISPPVIPYTPAMKKEVVTGEPAEAEEEEANQC